MMVTIRNKISPFTWMYIYSRRAADLTTELGLFPDVLFSLSEELHYIVEYLFSMPLYKTFIFVTHVFF